VSSRIPRDAFEVYVSLGPTRSYQALAERFGVDKRSIVRHAAKERWAERFEKIQAEAQAAIDKKLAEGLQEMQERHTKLLRGMATRVAQAIKEYPLTSCMDAIRAGEILIKMERIIAGQASERTELSVEEVTREEIHELLVKDEGEERP
jgi:hypothetical protein